MKADITIQLILFVINIGLATSAVIYYRKATKLTDEAGKLRSRLEAASKTQDSLFWQVRRLRTLRLKRQFPIPDEIKLDVNERQRFLDISFKEMAKELGKNMLADGLITIESISVESGFGSRSVFSLEISAMVLPPDNNSRYPL